MEEIRSKKGGKVDFLNGGCLHLVVLFDFIPGNKIGRVRGSEVKKAG